MKVGEGSDPKVVGRSRMARKDGVVIPHKPERLQVFVAGLVFTFERLLSASLRFRWHDDSGLFDRPPAKPVIYCVWHNRLALSMAIFRWCRRFQPERRLAALVSASKDGAFLARILENFGVQPVRGSSSRRGPQALLELTGLAERGYDIAITPDGPRGPRYRVQEGAIALAQVTGFPIVPVTCKITWKVRTRSWDRFQLPLPCARCDIFMSAPVTVPRDASDAAREAIRLQVEKSLGTED